MKQLLLSVGLLTAAAFPSSNAAEPAAAPAADRARAAAASPQVQVVTSMGNFTIELNAERAPLTVAQFLKYVDQGLLFRHDLSSRHPEFRDSRRRLRSPTTNSRAAPTKVVNESGNGLTNQRGTVGLARPLGTARRRRAVLRESQRQCGARSQPDALGLRGIRQSRAGHGRGGPHRQCAPPARKGPFKEDAPAQAGRHRADRARAGP